MQGEAVDAHSTGAACGSGRPNGVRLCTRNEGRGAPHGRHVDGAPADHAFVIAQVAPGALRRPGPRRWRPPEGEAWRQDRRLEEVAQSLEQVTLHSARDMCSAVQVDHRDAMSARMRRFDRVPFAVRSLWQRTAAAASAADRAEFVR